MRLWWAVAAVPAAPGAVRVPEHPAGHLRLPYIRRKPGDGGDAEERGAGEVLLRPHRQVQDGGVHDFDRRGAGSRLLLRRREQASVLQRGEAGDSVVAGIRRQSFPKRPRPGGSGSCGNHLAPPSVHQTRSSQTLRGRYGLHGPTPLRFPLG